MLLLTLAAVAAPPPPLAAQMHERFALLTAVRDAVVHGRLDDARVTARALAGYSSPEMPAGWVPLVGAVDAEAARVATAPDLVAAAVGTARIASACAACHVATSGGPSLDEGGDVPPQRWTAGKNMELHAWALDWMWLGLLAMDDGAWVRGASELARQPLPLRFEDAPPPGGRPQLEQGVYLLAGRALETDFPDERAEIYGTLLATCSECHTRSKGARDARR